MFDICMNIWEKVSKPPSERVNAFLYIAKVVDKYPELIPEVAYITQEQYTETLSPGIRKSYERLVQKLF